MAGHIAESDDFDLDDFTDGYWRTLAQHWKVRRRSHRTTLFHPLIRQPWFLRKVAACRRLGIFVASPIASVTSSAAEPAITFVLLATTVTDGHHFQLTADAFVCDR